MSEQEASANHAAEPADTQTMIESRAPAASAPASGQPGRTLSVLALLLALIALAGSAWMLWQGAGSASDDAQTEALAQRQEDLLEAQRVLEQRLTTLAEQLEQAQQPDPELARLRQSAEQQARALGELEAAQRALDDELREELQTLWQRDGVQREADQELERSLLLMEAASLLRLGQERLELALDLGAARQAWRRAAALVQRADDPRLGEVRRLLARELDSLEAVVEPDWAVLSARLARSADAVERWPVRVAEAQPADSAPGPDAESGWRRTMAAAFSRLVSIRPRDQLLLDEDTVAVLREQIRLRYTAAELALMRRDGSALDRQLSAINALIDTHFDSTSAEVRSAQAVVDELAALSMPAPPQGLGQGLAALRAQIESR